LTTSEAVLTHNTQLAEKNLWNPQFANIGRVKAAPPTTTADAVFTHKNQLAEGSRRNPKSAKAESSKAGRTGLRTSKKGITKAEPAEPKSPATEATERESLTVEPADTEILSRRAVKAAEEGSNDHQEEPHLSLYYLHV
jgi:hypothetical protein